ncbi:MAG: hypothetical protein E7477_04880 [Ruminococcaceae bacterium]|nr:hypothetical protein [Oscillospiraceae bacterium]
MKKFISCMILILMMFSFCSCGAQVEENFDLDLNGINGESTGIDLDGYEFSIMQADLVEGDGAGIFSYPDNTFMADAILDRFKEIQEEWNCTITVKNDNSDRLNSLTPILASGTYAHEAIYVSGPTSFSSAGFLYPMSVLSEYIDYTDSEKYGGSGIIEQGLFNGEIYAVSPITWPGKQMLTSYGVFAVNENLIMRYGKTDPRDYVENGEWTWDNFGEIIRQYEIDDGTVKAKALNISWSLINFAMLNGMDYVEVQDDGSVIPKIDSKAVADTLDWCSDLFTTYSDCITFDDHWGMLPKFLNDEIVITQTAIDHILRFMSYEMDNYGVVPMPCGPNGTYGEWKNAYTEYVCFGILINAKQPEAAAMILDRLCEPFEGYETEEDLKDYLSEYFFDDRDLDFVMNYFRNSRWNYWPLANIQDFFANAIDSTSSGRSSAEILEKNAENVNNAIEKYVVPNYEFTKQLEKSQSK